jgi:hypothetical protein
MKFYILKPDFGKAVYYVKMDATNGVSLAAWASHRGWFREAWIYSAIKFGYTGPASACEDWLHTELSEEDFNKALTKAQAEAVK